MKLATYQVLRGPRVAGLRDGRLVDLNDADPSLPSCPKTLLADGIETVRKAEKALAAGRPLDEPAAMLPPIPNPEKIICIGLNYADHARETGVALPSDPVVFNKFPTAASADGQPIVLPRSSSQVDYEAELVVVIGRDGRHVPRRQAMDHVAAYCCGNDVRPATGSSTSRADNGSPGKSSTRSPRSAPGWSPPTKCRSPAGSASSCGSTARRCNGPIPTSSSSPWKNSSITSRCMHLEAGRPALHRHAVGRRFARKPPVFLTPGDLVEVEIERLGTLRNPVIAEGA